jgi:hypothetical protein
MDRRDLGAWHWALPMLASAGILAPLIFTAGVMLAGRLRAGYDPLQHGISELALGPSGWLQTANFLVTGLLLIAFALGLFMALEETMATRAAVILFILGGGGLLVLGFFPRDLPGSAPTVHGTIHNVAGNSLLSLPVACLALGAAWRRDPGWRPYVLPSIGVGMLTLLLLPGYFYALRGGPLYPWIGLLQRLLVLGPLGWVEVVAVRLIRLALASNSYR